MKRQFNPAEPEMMDRPQPVSREFEDDLKNLRALNHYFGSYRLIQYFLCRWIKPGDRLRIVDLATGSGDIPRLIADHGRKIGAKIDIDALDRQPATIEIARGLSLDFPEISFIQADLLEWTPPEHYDIVLCSLALHHFSEEDAVRVLQRARAFSRRFVLVADLRRGLLGSIGVHLLTALIYRNPMTKFDARVSVARAFSFAEFAGLARRAGWKDFGHTRFRFARQALSLENIES